ncbi:MAG: metallophosphoesterase [Deltaproteobacteria bacterium]|nr:metallophosphoesterase [Deltaproteobacteria bacterium]
MRLIMMLLIFVVGHLFIFWSGIRFFAVKSPRLKNIVLRAALLLPLCVIASAVAVRFMTNAATGAVYAVFAVWLGLSINLLMFTAIAWMLTPIGRAFFKASAMRWLYAALFAAAFLFSAWGVWNAFHPVIKTVDVAIPGLPDKWRDKTIVQISDVHLGVFHTPGYFSNIAKEINGLRPDIIFITGDLFDSISADGLQPFVGPLNELRAGDGIFYVNGNHENYIGMDAVLSALKQTRIIPLRDDVVRIDGVRIIGVDFPEYGVERDVMKFIRSRRDFGQGGPVILLYHTPTSIVYKGRTVSEHQTSTYWNPDVDYTAAKELGVNLQLSGHTHKGQIFPFGLLTARLYRGYDYGLHTDGGFSIYTSCGLGSFGPPMRTGNTPEIVVIRLRPAAPV